MIFSKQIEKVYKSRMFKRYDDNGTVFYFSERDFNGLQKEPFSFKTPKGNRLQGYFYSYENPIQNRIVVFDHGMGGGHRAYMCEIEKLAKGGYLVFSYDHTGCMESEGESTNGFATSLADLDAALTAIKSDEKYKNFKISVMGHSWGAYSTQNIGALHPDIAHIIAMSGPISVESIVNQSFSGVLKGYRKSILELETEANPRYVNFNAAESLKKFSGQILIIHSEDDKTVNRQFHFDVLQKALEGKENARFLLVNGKNHNPNYTTDAVEYMGNYFAELTRKTKKGLLKTEEQKKEFLNKFDWHRMTKQDETVWEEIFKTLEK